MWRYLKAAFFLRVPVAGLGGVPLNILMLVAAGIMGVLHPAFWLLGLAYELVYLTILATNGRFQNVIDGLQLTRQDGDTQTKYKALIQQLSPMSKDQLAAIEAKCKKCIDLYTALDSDQFLIDSNQQALRKLSWLYLKLLIARHYLQSADAKADEKRIRDQIDKINAQLKVAGITKNLQESQTATLELLQKRLNNLQQREQSLAEIDADMTRIETQVDLAVETATMQGKPTAISGNISLASHLLEPDFLGPAQSAIDELEPSYVQAPVQQ